MKKLILCVCLTALLLPATIRADDCLAVLVLDRSQSTHPFEQAIKREATELIYGLPGNCKVSLLGVNRAVEHLAEMTSLGDAGRLEISRTIGRVEHEGFNTDLGKALKEAVHLTENSAGKKTIYFFTDGENRPLRASPFRGISFQTILEQPQAVPDNVHVIVRIFGQAAVTTKQANIVVLRSSSGMAARPTVTTSAPVPSSTSHGWELAAIIGFACACLGITFAATAFILMALKWKDQRQRTEDLAAMRRPRSTMEHSAEQPKWRWTLRSLDTASSEEWYMDNSPAELTIGSGLEAEVYREVGGTAKFRFEEGRLFLYNLEGQVAIGDHHLREGSQVDIPAGVWIVRLGSIASGEMSVILFPERYFKRRGSAPDALASAAADSIGRSEEVRL